MLIYLTSQVDEHTVRTLRAMASQNGNTKPAFSDRFPPLSAHRQRPHGGYQDRRAAHASPLGARAREEVWGQPRNRQAGARRARTPIFHLQETGKRDLRRRAENPPSLAHRAELQ